MGHFLRIGDLDLGALVELGLAMSADRQVGSGSLEGKAVGLFFQKPSTRTRISTEVAIGQLGGQAIVLGNETVGLGSREAAIDVVRVMERYVDAVAMRVFEHSELEAMQRVSAVPIINLLSDLAHPCQAVADVMTLAAERPLAGATVSYVGDGNNVCASLARAVAATGGTMHIATPKGYELPADELAGINGPVFVTNDPTEAVES